MSIARMMAGGLFPERWSRLFCSCCLLLGAMCAGVVGDDGVVAKHLKSRGGEVTLREGRVTELMFRSSRDLGPEEWGSIGQLTQLKKLTVYGGAQGLNDETVEKLVPLQELESLSTDGAQLSDDGLAKLAELKSLKSVAFFHLSFRKEGFTGKGFAAWKQLPQLERLTVAGMSIGDEGFEQISQLQSLKELRVWHTYRTEASNTDIAKLPQLKTLKLGQRLPRGSGTPLSLSNDSLKTLLQITTLETLEIGETDFSVTALSTLKGLPNLKVLKIDTTELTEEDIAQLRLSLPGIRIEFKPITDEQRVKLQTYLR